MTTSLSDLPIDNNTPQVTFNVADKAPVQQNTKLDPNINTTYNPAPPISNEKPVTDIRPEEPMSTNNMTEFINTLESAASSGMTQLPTRDIPINENVINHDEEIKPNFVPSAQDYILEYDNTQDVIEQNNKKLKEQDNMEYLYQELQVPILIGILYFIFLLPITTDFMYKFTPNLFNNDGNLNTIGTLIKSILFSVIYYCLTKFMIHVSTI